MSTIRLALANLPVPSTPAESVDLALQAIDEAGWQHVDLICFPECYVPGYRTPGKAMPPPDGRFLDDAWSLASEAAKRANVAVVLGTERLVQGALRATALVIARDGLTVGFQDKVQIDPAEEGTYTPASGRRVFHSGDLTFGIAICHEGYRYPETVRWAVRNGAQLVLHPHFFEAEPGGYRPTAYGDPANTFHENAALCRAAENTCFFATVNCASPGSPTTSAIVSPTGRLLAWQPYGQPGLLIADLNLIEATGLLARRYRPMSEV